jgi:DNA-binding MarR family transcriptional regulator
MTAKSTRTLLLVRLLQVRLYNEMVEALRLFDLTPPQYLVLSLASRSSSWSTADLARRFDIAPQSMNEVIAALEGKKLIARRESPDHRRILHIRLKASGTRLLEKCDAAADRIERSAFGDLSPRELAAFRDTISKALTTLARNASDASRPASDTTRANGPRRVNGRDRSPRAATR